MADLLLPEKPKKAKLVSDTQNDFVIHTPDFSVPLLVVYRSTSRLLAKTKTVVNVVIE